MKNVIIVGAGIAGLFCAIKLIEKGKYKIQLIDKGNSAFERDSNTIFGVGGAGGYFDGKQHYSPILSHKKLLDIVDEKEYKQKMDEVEKLFTYFGAKNYFYPNDRIEAKKLINDAKQHNIDIITRRLRHLGSDTSSQISRKMEKYLIGQGVEIITNTEIKDLIVQNNKIIGVKTVNHEELLGDIVILAPGRIGVEWLKDIATKYQIELKSLPIEIGCRFEIPNRIFEKYTKTFYDPIFISRIQSTQKMFRTFCTCPSGTIQIERHNQYCLVNGASSLTYKSDVTNFAILTEISNSEISGNTTDYAMNLAKYISKITGNKPIVQRFGDFLYGKKSKAQNFADKKHINIDEYAFIDINIILPYSIVVTLKEGILMLEKVIKGISSKDNVIYAPEMKFRSLGVKVGYNFQATIENLYFAGDGAGLSGNIVGAAINGLLVAEKINY